MATLEIAKVEYPAYFGYLKESEAELLRVGTTQCDRMRDESQLSAVVFLLIRATSLFRSVLSILHNGQLGLDAFDAVRRAYLESWLLAFEFRLHQSQSKTVLWHRGKDKSWSASLQVLVKYARSQGIEEPMLGHDYGGLSKVAHPTKVAAMNSVVSVTAPPSGTSIETISLREARTNLEHKDIPEMMYRFLWLIIEERAGLIEIGTDTRALPTAVRYANEYAKTFGLQHSV